MIYVPQAPVKPGCYVWMPHECPRPEAANAFDRSKYSVWVFDGKGRESNEACLARKAQFDRSCGANLTRVMFIASAPKAETGTPILIEPEKKQAGLVEPVKPRVVMDPMKPRAENTKVDPLPPAEPVPTKPKKKNA